MIPKELIYRVYGDSLAILMNVKTKRIVLLKNELLRFWKKILKTNSVDKTDPIVKQLADLGVLENLFGHHAQVNHSNFPLKHPQEVNMGVVNLWAFKNSIPISGHFELTGRCNLRCRHCYCVFNKQEDSLATDKILKIIDNLKTSGTFGLVLTGGEIFCRDDILDILNYLSEKKFVLRINSNGTLITETHVKAMERMSNIYRIHISLYSSEPEIHDRITNTPGSFHKTLNTLNLLKEAGFDLRINCSVMKSNVDTYKKIAGEIGDKMGIPVHYDSEIYPKDDGGTENLKERLDDEELHDFLRVKFNYKNTPQLPGKKKLCKAGFSFFSICEDGSLFPCLKMKRFYRHPLGNLSVDPFSSIWKKSEAIQKIRGSLNKKLRECNICDLNI